MRALLIDPIMKSITQFDYSGDFNDVYNHIDCKIFTAIYPENVNGDCVFLDDEGLFKEQLFGWTFDGTNFVGKGMILGSDDGRSVATTLDPTDIINRIEFLGEVALR